MNISVVLLLIFSLSFYPVLCLAQDEAIGRSTEEVDRDIREEVAEKMEKGPGILSKPKEEEKDPSEFINIEDESIEAENPRAEEPIRL